MLFFLAVSGAILTWKWGAWRKWRLYYPTILFLILGNFIYIILTYNHPLWIFESKDFDPNTLDLLITFLLYPCKVLLFLPNYPRSGFVLQVRYILMWVIILVFIEWLSYILGYISYHNGWNLWWSTLFNCVMLPLILLHHSRPFLGWLAAAGFGISLIILFRIPYSSMR